MSGLAYISSGVLTTTAITLGDAMPGHSKQILAVAGVLTMLAGLITRMVNNQTGKPATSIVAGSPVVAPPPYPEPPAPTPKGP